jgi:hypothetical protein
MTGPDPQEMRTARSARTVALVLAVTMILWMGVQVVGADMGWDPRYAFLFDLAALAAFFWALVVTYQIWRARRREG